MGKQTAKKLANMGARVVMICRSKERGEKARQDIMADNPNAQLDLIFCDFVVFQRSAAICQGFSN
ncbi:MAG: hypothetical protein R6U96_05125 [Promethearchaeia archaeon]